MSRFLDRKLQTLEPYTPGEQPRDMGKLIKLNTNESPFPPAPGVLDILTRGQSADLRLYPDMNCTALRAAIGAFYGVEPQRVFAGNGSDDVLAFCFHGFCPNGAAFADITYGFYPVFAQMFGVQETIVPLRADFSIDPQDYAGIKSTVFIANPNAPTGLCLAPGQIEALCRQNPDRLVIVDEAYVDFGGETVVGLTEKYDNLLVVQTFSKSRQLAGGRLGFAIGAKALIDDLNAMKFAFNPYSINRLTLLAGQAAMEDRAYFDKTRGQICENRAFAREKLIQMGFSVTDSRANFLFARAPGLSGGAYYKALRDRGILVRWFDRDRIRDYVRITVGTREQMETLIEETAQILRQR